MYFSAIVRDIAGTKRMWSCGATCKTMDNTVTYLNLTKTFSDSLYRQKCS